MTSTVYECNPMLVLNIAYESFYFCFFLQHILKLNEDQQQMCLLKTLFNLSNSINSANLQK